jgi:hypothetical protein
MDDVVTLLPFVDQTLDDFGRILQVGVHHDDRVALCGIHAGGDRDLMTEIAR